MLKFLHFVLHVYLHLQRHAGIALFGPLHDTLKHREQGNT